MTPPTPQRNPGTQSERTGARPAPKAFPSGEGGPKGRKRAAQPHPTARTPANPHTKAFPSGEGGPKGRKRAAQPHATAAPGESAPASRPDSILHSALCILHSKRIKIFLRRPIRPFHGIIPPLHQHIVNHAHAHIPQRLVAQVQLRTAEHEYRAVGLPNAGSHFFAGTDVV